MKALNTRLPVPNTCVMSTVMSADHSASLLPHAPIERKPAACKHMPPGSAQLLPCQAHSFLVMKDMRTCEAVRPPARQQESRSLRPHAFRQCATRGPPKDTHAGRQRATAALQLPSLPHSRLCLCTLTAWCGCMSHARSRS